MPLYDLHKKMKPTVRRLAISYYYLIVILNACRWVRVFRDIRRNSAGVCFGWIPVASAANWRSVSGDAPRSPAAEVVLAAGSEMEGTCNLTLGETLLIFVHRDRQNQHKMKSFRVALSTGVHTFCKPQWIFDKPQGGFWYVMQDWTYSCCCFSSHKTVASYSHNKC